MGKETACALRNIYLERYALEKIHITAPPHPDLSMVITIPCYHEENLQTALKSLKSCDLPEATAVEVIVVINESEEEEPFVSDFNKTTYQEALDWAEENSSARLSFCIIYEKLKPKHAGVGLARKVAMDEAVRRFESIGKTDGIILCYDADCTCDTNYLTVVYNYFKNINCVGASIYYEHPLSGDLDERIYKGIIHYELYLRYYANALRWIGYPFAHQTIGSSMAVRNDIYQKVGGMNRRKAGEDFYFLHKVMPMGKFGEITKTKVIPSPRASDRVPFGTGKAINKFLVEGKIEAYDLLIFEELQKFIADVHLFYEDHSIQLDKYPKAVSEYLFTVNAESKILSIINRSDRKETYLKHFYNWFDGLQVLKYVHYARDHHYPSTLLPGQVKKLASFFYNEDWPLDLHEQLIRMRTKDRKLG